MCRPSKLAPLVVSTFIFAVLASSGIAQAADALKLPKQLVMATNGAGGVANTMGSAFASILTRYSGTKTTLLPIGNPEKWIEMARNDEVDLGMSSLTSLSWVYWGTGPKHPKSNKVINLVAVGAPATWGFFVPADAPVHNPDQLKKWLHGKRLTHHWINPVIDHLNLAYLADLGFRSLKEAGLTAVPVSSYRVFVSLWNEQRVDVVGMPTGIPLVQQMSAARPGRFVALYNNPAAVARLHQVEPSYYVSEQLPTVLGVDKKLSLLTYDYAIVARADLSPAIVRHILTTLYDHQKELGEMGRSLKRWLPAKMHWASPNATFPYHPGAVAFYKEKGLWTGEMNRKQEKFIAESADK